MAGDKFNFYVWFSFNFLLLFCIVVCNYMTKKYKGKNSHFKIIITLSNYMQCIQLAELGTPIVQ